MSSAFDPIIESLRLTWIQIRLISPRLLGAVFLVTVGWLVARGVRWTVVRLLRLLRVDRLAERAGIEDFLLRGGVRFTIVTLIGQVVYWVVFLAMGLAVFNLIGVPVAASLVERVTDYLPNVLVAMVILLFGSLLGQFVRGLVQTYLSNVGAGGSTLIGLLVEATILVFVATLALQQLEIGSAILVSAFQLAFGGLCLGLALAFGLGGRKWAEGLLERWKVR